MNIHIYIYYVYTNVCMYGCMQCNAMRCDARQGNATQCMYTTYLMYASILLCTIDYVFNIIYLYLVYMYVERKNAILQNHI